MAAKKKIQEQEEKREYQAFCYETALCNIEEIQYQNDKSVPDVLENYAERCLQAAQQFHALATILRLREDDIRGAEGNVGEGGFCLPAEDFGEFAKLPWSPFDPVNNCACEVDECEDCEHGFRHGQYESGSNCLGDCSACPIAQAENPCLRLDSWRMTAGINKEKEERHGGEYLCPDCWPGYEEGAPSGVVLVTAVPKDEVIACKLCGAVWMGREA